jgi:hypothetical protein
MGGLEGATNKVYTNEHNLPMLIQSPLLTLLKMPSSEPKKSVFVSIGFINSTDEKFVGGEPIL